jgi:hypothetical protein
MPRKVGKRKDTMSRAGDLIRRHIEIVEDGEGSIPLIRDVRLYPSQGTYERLDEGKWISGQFPNNIRLDQPMHTQGVGKLHGHVHDRKGNEIVTVNFDGTPSHGSKGRLSHADADALRKRGFNIRQDRIVEWWTLPKTDSMQLLFE